MKNSAIQWTDHTFNAWQGCTKVAPECKNCYAEVMVDHRFGRARWGKGQPRARTTKSYWSQPIGWNRFFVCDICGELGLVGNIHDGSHKLRRQRVFCLSLGDWLDEEVPIEWLADLLALIHATPNLDWQLLTKRPQNWKARIRSALEFVAQQSVDDQLDWEWIENWLIDKAPLENIWIGVSAGADQRAALDIPAKVHFLSCEPMLHEFDTTHAAGFDWIIFGGESGNNARICRQEWIRTGIVFCRKNGVAAFVKQMGANCRVGSERDGEDVRIGFKDSHGGDWNEWPEDLRVREFPA